jgi:hypothetical protein
MDLSVILLRAIFINILLTQPFVAFFSRLETYLLPLLGLPTATSFRMFPPDDYNYLTHLVEQGTQHVHAISALMLVVFVPYLAYTDLHISRDCIGPSNLTTMLWKRGYKGSAMLLCLVRIWLLTAIWNYFLFEDIEDTVAQALDSWGVSRAIVRHPLIIPGSLWLIF